MKTFQKNLNKEIKTDIPKEIRDVVIDLLSYLRDHGYFINKYIKKVNAADFFLATEKNFKYNVEYKGTITVSNTPLLGGFYKSFERYDSDMDKVVMVKEIVVVRKSEKVSDMRGRIMHEVLHLLSSNDIYESNGKYYNESGLFKSLYVKQGGSKVKIACLTEDIVINEAITDMLRFKLMEEIYGVPYGTYKDFEGNVQYYNSGYFLISNMMQIFDLAFVGSTDVTKLLKIYLTNNQRKFFKLVEKKIGLDQSCTRNIFMNLFTKKQKLSKIDNEELYVKFVFEEIYSDYYKVISNMCSRLNYPELKAFKEYFESLPEISVYMVIKNSLLEKINSYI